MWDRGHPPTIYALAITAGVVAVDINEIQNVQSAQLDIEMKRIKLQGMRNGVPVTFEQTLTNDECRKIAHEGKVNVNGRLVRVSFAYVHPFTP